MRRAARRLLALALLAATAPAAAQDSGPLAALIARGANPDGPFAKHIAPSDSLVARAREGAPVKADRSALRRGDLLRFGRHEAAVFRTSGSTWARGR